MKAFVSVTNDLYTDQRVHKVCTFLVDQGYDVCLVGRKRKSSMPLNPRNYRTKRMRLLFETGALFYAAYNIRLFLFLLFRRADLLVSNDLDTLLANHWAKKFKRNCRLVYDSHEYFTEVPELINRPKVRNVWLKIERKIFPSLLDVYTVNSTIQKVYEEKYNKKIKVVRNISRIWNPAKIQDKKSLGIPEGKKLIIMQGAGINIDRGAEEAIEAMANIDAVLLIVGSGDVIEQLKLRVKEIHLEKKVRFYGRLPYDEMMNYTYHADIGLTLDKPKSLNYKYSLPNKVFDYMHTSTPIIATDIKEVANVISKYSIGEIVDPFTIDNLSLAIRSLLDDIEKLELFKSNCQKAAQIENWNNELDVLKEIYPKVD